MNRKTTQGKLARIRNLTPTPDTPEPGATADQNPTEPPPPMKVAEVARKLGVSVKHVYELFHRGQLGYLQVGRAYRVPVADYEEFRKRNTHPAANRDPQ